MISTSVASSRRLLLRFSFTTFDNYLDLKETARLTSVVIRYLGEHVERLKG